MRHVDTYTASVFTLAVATAVAYFAESGLWQPWRPNQQLVV